MQRFASRNSVDEEKGDELRSLKPKSMVYKKLLGTREAVREKFKRAPSKE